jgi:hypothetical protein
MMNGYNFFLKEQQIFIITMLYYTIYDVTTELKEWQQ